MNNSNARPRLLRFGLFEVDFRTAELRKQGLKVKLHGQPFQILAILVERPGELVTREEIREKIWPADTFIDFEHSVNNSIKRLREALGDTAEHPRYIETLPRRGYRFIYPLEGGQGLTVPAKAQQAESVHEAVGPAVGAVRDLSRSDREPPLRRRVMIVAGLRSRLAAMVRKRWRVLPAALILVAAAIGGTLYFRSRQTTTRLADKDTIVLSDFDNKTGDSVFDDTLKQGLSVQLEQSPFLALVSDRKVNETLKLMGRPAGDRLTPEVTREVCQRITPWEALAAAHLQFGTY